MSSRILFIIVLATFALRAGGQDMPTPPLPEVPEGGMDEAFTLIPLPGEEAPPELPGEGNPVQPPPPANDLPDIPPITSPDDEVIPELPRLPGLTPPPQILPTTPSPTDPTDRPPSSLNPTPGKGQDREDPTRLAASVYWYASPRQARKVSMELERPLFLLFTHSADKNSALLQEDILMHPDFKSMASKSLILTHLKYGRDALSALDREQKEAREAALESIKQRFTIKSFPTVLLLDEKGKEMFRMSYHRTKNPYTGETFSTAEYQLERLQDSVKYWTRARDEKAQKMERLAADGYRQWQSRSGSSLFAKMTYGNDEGIVLMDENNRKRSVYFSQLKLGDAEWARRAHRETTLGQSDTATPASE